VKSASLRCAVLQTCILACERCGYRYRYHLDHLTTVPSTLAPLVFGTSLSPYSISAAIIKSTGTGQKIEGDGQQRMHARAECIHSGNTAAYKCRHQRPEHLAKMPAELRILVYVAVQ
jgi:hypothetical protein